MSGLSNVPQTAPSKWPQNDLHFSFIKSVEIQFLKDCFRVLALIKFLNKLLNSSEIVKLSPKNVCFSLLFAITKFAFSVVYSVVKIVMGATPTLSYK